LIIKYLYIKLCVLCACVLEKNMKEFVGQNTDGVKKIPLHYGCFIFKRKKDNRK
jgi:hypothetical protein